MLIPSFEQSQHNRQRRNALRNLLYPSYVRSAIPLNRLFDVSKRGQRGGEFENFDVATYKKAVA